MRVRVAIVLAAALPAGVLAQTEARSEPEASTPREHRTVPELNGHVFSPSLLIDTPFRMTTFKLGILYGIADATGPRYDINGNITGQGSYTAGALAQTFRYEYAFLDWLSAGAVVATTMYTGLDGPSAVSVGAEFGIGGGLRVKAGHRFGPIDAAVIVDATTGPAYGVLVAAAVIEAIKNRVLDPGAAFQATHQKTVNPSLAASWAPMPALGVTANVGYVFESLTLADQTVTDQNGMQFAGAVDFDFGKISPVPIALLAAYRRTVPVGNSGIPTVQDASGGIFYSGIRELGLGLEVGWRSFTLRPGTNTALDTSGTVAQLGIQYYW